MSNEQYVHYTQYTHFRRNAIAFRAIGIGFGNVPSFVRHEISSSNISKITKFYGDIHTDIVYNHTGYDIITYFRSAANRAYVYFGSYSGRDFSVTVRPKPILKRFKVLETVIQGVHFSSATH